MFEFLGKLSRRFTKLNFCALSFTLVTLNERVGFFYLKFTEIAFLEIIKNNSIKIAFLRTSLSFRDFQLVMEKL